ncbi:lactonase family protein [Labilibaculum sp.]|uniref:lactonase family protein n=1 Tax=Labilibaculum sp. TaxID=2060723 RepID=UPI003563BD45
MSKHIFLLILISALAFSCQESKKNTPMTNSSYTFFLGTYTDGDSQGIYKFEMDSLGQLKMLGLVAKSDNPSFLAFANHQKTLLVANEMKYEDGMGSVESYQIGDSLQLISRKPSGGAHPCFVTANVEGVVLAANYTGGNIGYLQVDEAGKLSDLLDVQQHSGSGTVVGRQDEPHAHSVWFQPNTNQIAAVDLGTNELWLSSIDMAKHQFSSDIRKVALADGAGPRHLVFHPNGKFVYIISELNNTISCFQISETKEFKLLSTISSLPAHFEAYSATADIHISSDGKYLYGSNRGHNSIAIFSIQENGDLHSIGFESTRGDHPRNFSLSPDDKFLLVANKNTNNIVCFQRDSLSGSLTFVDEVKAPSPVCILFEN